MFIKNNLHISVSKSFRLAVSGILCGFLICFGVSDLHAQKNTASKAKKIQERKEKQRKKEQARAYKAGKKFHKSIQTRATRKRMKQNLKQTKQHIIRSQHQVKERRSKVRKGTPKPKKFRRR
jgi:hypothetical protein